MESCSFFIFMFSFIDCLPCFVRHPALSGFASFISDSTCYRLHVLVRFFMSCIQVLTADTGRHHGGPRLDFWLRGYTSRGRKLHLIEASPPAFHLRRYYLVSGHHQHMPPLTDLSHQPALPSLLNIQ